MQRVMRWLASPWWMLAFFVFAIFSAWYAAREPDWITALWVPPLGMFAVSLVAAIVTNPRFRRDWPLLGMHLGLLMFVLALLLSRLSYLDGAVTLNQGQAFDGKLQVDRRGFLHPGEVERLRFVNEGFVESYGRNARWQATRNRVRWWDGSGTSQVSVIGDDYPLILDGYHIYTTFNRGYAPVFRWQPLGGVEQVGSVQLRANPFDRANSWRLPGGPELWAMLELPENAELQRGEQRRNLGGAELPHRLVIRTQEMRTLLQPGESLQLPQGRLTYLSLDSWMGYRVVYDQGQYWLAASAAAVVLCMLAFYARLLGRGSEKG